jgi:hypothetical protein
MAGAIALVAKAMLFTNVPVTKHPDFAEGYNKDLCITAPVFVVLVPVNVVHLILISDDAQTIDGFSAVQFRQPQGQLHDFPAARLQSAWLWDLLRRLSALACSAKC